MHKSQELSKHEDVSVNFKHSLKELSMVLCASDPDLKKQGQADQKSLQDSQIEAMKAQDRELA